MGRGAAGDQMMIDYTRPARTREERANDALAAREISERADSLKRALAELGLRAESSAHLVYERGLTARGGARVIHLKASSTAQDALCPRGEDDYGSLLPPRSLARAPRGSWQLAGGRGSRLVRCSSCVAELKRIRQRGEPERYREMIGDSEERSDYPLLPSSEMAGLELRVSERIARGGSAQDALRSELIEWSLAEAQRPGSRALDRLLGERALDRLERQLPRGTGKIGRLLPVRLSEWLSAEQIRVIYAGALPTDLTAPYDWEELAQRASARLRELIELKLAKARLARGSADQEILGVI